jgi:hypothetical protein
MKACSAIVLWAIAVAGCSPSAAPTAPSGAPSGAPSSITRVTGTVYDTAFRAISGVRIEALDGTTSGAAATTEDHGYFDLRGTFDEKTRFRVSKDGYITSTGLFLSVCQSCDLKIYLGVDAPPLALAGAYTLTFAADSSCTELPASVRRRSYPATVAALPSPNLPANTQFRVTVGGATFLTGHETVSIHSAGDYLSWSFDDSGVISEQVAANSYLTFAGKAAASVGPSGVSNFAFPFEGGIEYCELKSPPSNVAQCNAAQAALYSRCASTNHQLILERR